MESNFRTALLQIEQPTEAVLQPPNIGQFQPSLPTTHDIPENFEPTNIFPLLGRLGSLSPTIEN